MASLQSCLPASTPYVVLPPHNLRRKREEQARPSRDLAWQHSYSREHCIVSGPTLLHDVALILLCFAAAVVLQHTEHSTERCSIDCHRGTTQLQSDTTIRPTLGLSHPLPALVLPRASPAKSKHRLSSEATRRGCAARLRQQSAVFASVRIIIIVVISRSSRSRNSRSRSNEEQHSSQAAAAAGIAALLQQ